MIDHVFKRPMDAFWDRLSTPLVRSGISPNAITLVSLVLVLANSALLVWHRSFALFGGLLALFELLDNVDGAVARVSGRASKAGAFLDATTDRVKELFSLAAVAYVSGAYLPALLAVGGGMLVSYALCRAVAEGAGPLTGFPPLFERLERVALLCVTTLLVPFLPELFGISIIVVGLWVLAIGSLMTGAQRTVQGFAAVTAAENGRKR